ncbi:chromate efflux transporter [Pseudohoeflea coraliihabitans]|uniref:Chromate efflux transporter n=1 Tax=Pseudohoeflea coraliihabitans TaxID=2860393 RepID=A0ABS6WM09_9HYPH|nr:chromate transporter [Pseudohoeflea sp. DP4N28-3]MBW3096104.1 chromate efflux transporter [Pseudohoeflea sp. DP4N28-3]
MPEVAREPVSWREMFAVYGRIGLLSFGGPAGQIALMHRELVEERRWLDEPRFLHALNFCMLLPGPEAMQLATYAGWLMRGTAGGLLAGLLFVLPGFLVMLLLSAAYLYFGDVPAVAGILLGLKAAVLAIVAQALIRLSRRALQGRLAWILAVGALVGIAFLNLPFPLIVLAAGLIGLMRALTLRQNEMSPDAEADFTEQRPLRPGDLAAIPIWGTIWLLPLALLMVLWPGVYSQMALFFSQAAIVTFGGAYAVLAYVGQQAVEVQGWLLPGDMLAGLGLAETTPGPLILVLVFVGFLGGARSVADGALGAGLIGGSVALFFTFAPCFLWIFAGAPHVERLRHVRWLAASLAAITAAIVGVIANLTLWFGLHVLFGRVDALEIGLLSLPVPDIESLNGSALLISLAAGLALIRFKTGLFKVLFGAVAAGLALTLLGVA